jgi:8-oxo-dGTP pyrophosphatase MutT (NUDIX family)
MAGMETTWDGLPVAREQPHVCAIVVRRAAQGGREFLVLHRRAPGAKRYEGDSAWTPPSGAPQPAETPDQAAARELPEETGLGNAAAWIDAVQTGPSTPST